MSTSFYKFLIDELLVKYFKQNNIEAGDKFYVMIEDTALRQHLYKAFDESVYAKHQDILFKDEEGFESTATANHLIVLDCGEGKQVLVSDCDCNNDGLQTKIRNSVGVEGNPVSDMAALFILPGSSAIETLLTAGHNLQDYSFPLNAFEIVKEIEKKVSGTINNIEREYLSQHFDKLKKQDDYTSLFDFEPVLSILQQHTIKGKFNDLGAFEDDEIYNNMFTAINTKVRVKENTEAFAKIADCMGETYEEDQRKLLSTLLDSKLVNKIVKDPEKWRTLNWKEVQKSIQIHKANAVLNIPTIKILSNDCNVQHVCNVVGTNKKSKTYVIVCDPTNTLISVKCSFNKELKDYEFKGEDKVKVMGSNMVFLMEKDLMTGKIGDTKNSHEVYVLRLKTQNVFKEIQQHFKLDKKKNIIVDVPDAMTAIRIGYGENLVIYDKFTPIELNDNDFFRLDIDPNANETPEIPFKFGDSIVFICFKYKTEKAPTLPPSAIVDNIWESEGGKYKIDEDGNEVDGTVTGAEGPVYLHERLRRLANLEKRMIDNGANHLITQKNIFGDKNEIKCEYLLVAQSITNALNNIFAYFKANHTVPSLFRPDDTLCSLYEKYLDTVHQEIEQIPTGKSLDIQARNLAKIGVVEQEDGSIMLSPFHPLMVAYSLQMKMSVNREEFNKKVIDELSPLSLMPYINYGKHTMQVICTTETEDLLTWVKYIRVENDNAVSSSKAISKLVTEKIRDFISHFKYYFPDVNCPLRISAIGLNNSVDLIRGIVNYIEKNRDSMQCIEIHEYLDDMLKETFFEKLNRNSSRDNISNLFALHNFGVNDNDLNEIIRLLFTRVSYYKHTYRENRTLVVYSHIVFYKIDTGTQYSPLPTHQLRTETVLDGLVSTPSTCFNAQKYLMGFGTNGLKDLESPIYKIAIDMNSLYAGLYNGGLSAYSKGQCTAKVYSFDDADFLESVYQKAIWVTFINPEVDINFFYKQDNVYVVHYVEQHSISAKLESITVTKHTKQYNNLLFNSLQTFKSIIGTSEEFSRKMINYFNCLNGKWLLDIIRKPDIVIREKMSLVATCFIMNHFMKRADNIIWIPVALDEIVKATGSIGTTTDGLFSKKDLGLDGPVSDDIMMIGLENSETTGDVNLYFYPVEVKVLSNDAVEHGEVQIVNLYKNALKDRLFTGNTFTRKVYRALFASQFLSNAEKMKANQLISNEVYEHINNCRYELLNVKFNVREDLPEEMGKAALVVYSDASAKSINTEWIEGVPVCHIRMMEADCYRIVANPDTDLLSFVEASDINMIDQLQESTSEAEDVIEEMIESALSLDIKSELATIAPIQEPLSVAEEPDVIINRDVIEPCIKIIMGTTKNGQEIVFEPNNTDKVSHPNLGIIGTMGTGKTQLARSVIAQFAKEECHNVGDRPVGMLVFDYKGDYNDEDFLQTVGGQCFCYSFPFNPLKLIITEKTKFMNLPSITADRISDSFAKAYNLGNVQQSTIKQVIVDTFADFGITRAPNTWNKPLPTMQNVVDKYFKEHDSKDSVYALFSKLNDYTIFAPANTDCVSLFEWLDGVKVIDLTPYPDDTKKVIVSLILDLFYEEMRQLGGSKLDGKYRELRSMILVDEAHQFLKKDFNSFRNIISEGRMFGVGMILSTQNISDFKSSKMEYSQFILSWIIHHVNSITRAEISNIFGTSDPNFQGYMDFVSNAKKFESICKLGNTINGIKDLPYYKLIQEDPRFSSSTGNK